MNRRQLIKLLVSGVVGQSLDVDRLLWTPTKKIFVLNGIAKPSISEIIALEYERVNPQIHKLFERDDLFYASIKKRDVEIVSSREMRIPLTLRASLGKE